MKQNNYLNRPDCSLSTIPNKTNKEDSASIIYSSVSTVLHHAHNIKDQHRLKDLVYEPSNLTIINNKDCFGETALTKAVYFGNDFLVKLLLDNGAYAGVLDTQKKTVLHYIENLKDKEVIENLIKKCTEAEVINNKDQNGYTPLDVAFFYNNIANMKLLLHYGANIKIDDSFYYICCRLDDDEAQEFLIKKLAELGVINHKDRHGYTPLLLSIIHSNDRITHLLLKYGAEVEITDRFCENPLHYAWRIVDLNVQRELVIKGVTAGIINDKNSLGETPLDRAIVCGNSQLKIILIEHKAKPNITQYAETTLTGEFEDSSDSE